MHAPVEKPKQPEKPPEPKYRTITLTHRAPVHIDEERWEEIARGSYGNDPDDGDFHRWKIEFRVRRSDVRSWIISGVHKREIKDVIIYGKYNYSNALDEDQTVLVGHYVEDAYKNESTMWKEMLEVAEELRSRIFIERLRKYVGYAIDHCFASLPPIRK